MMVFDWFACGEKFITVSATPALMLTLTLTLKLTLTGYTCIKDKYTAEKNALPSAK